MKHSSSSTQDHPPHSALTTRNSKPFPPRSVTILRWGVLLLGLRQLWQAVAINQQSALLTELGASPVGWQLRLWGALIAALLALLICGLLWLRQRSSRWLTPLLCGGVTLYELLVRITIDPSAVARQSWPLTLLIGGLATAVVVWLVTRPAALSYLNRRP